MFDVGINHHYDPEIYYVKCNLNTSIDGRIARKLGMLTCDYRKVMIEQFNGFIQSNCNDVFFKTREDTEKAIEWIESRYIMKKLID